VSVSGNNGWYISAGGKQLGPLSADEMLSRAIGKSFAADDLVWHPSLQDWTSAYDLFSTSEARPVPKSGITPTTMLLAREIKITNSYYITLLFAGVTSCSNMMIMAFLSDEATMGFLFLSAFVAVGWWCFVEFRGIQFRGPLLVFPRRLPFWPHLPGYKMATIAVDRISYTEVFSVGRYTHGLTLSLSDARFTLFFDDLFLRDLMLAAILIRNTHNTAAPRR
jgi:hypothetical protein